MKPRNGDAASCTRQAVPRIMVGLSGLVLLLAFSGAALLGSRAAAENDSAARRDFVAYRDSSDADTRRITCAEFRATLRKV